jgi:hypothetical protein
METIHDNMLIEICDLLLCLQSNPIFRNLFSKPFVFVLSSVEEIPFCSCLRSFSFFFFQSHFVNLSLIFS